MVLDLALCAGRGGRRRPRGDDGAAARHAAVVPQHHAGGRRWPGGICLVAADGACPPGGAVCAPPSTEPARRGARAHSSLPPFAPTPCTCWPGGWCTHHGAQADPATWGRSPHPAAAAWRAGGERMEAQHAFQGGRARGRQEEPVRHRCPGHGATPGLVRVTRTSSTGGLRPHAHPEARVRPPPWSQALPPSTLVWTRWCGAGESSPPTASAAVQQAWWPGPTWARCVSASCRAAAAPCNAPAPATPRRLTLAPCKPWSPLPLHCWFAVPGASRLRAPVLGGLVGGMAGFASGWGQQQLLLLAERQQPQQQPAPVPGHQQAAGCRLGEQQQPLPAAKQAL